MSNNKKKQISVTMTLWNSYKHLQPSWCILCSNQSWKPMLPFSKTSSLHAWCHINGSNTGNPFFKRRNQSHPWFQYRKPSLQEEESESSMVSIQETLSSREGIRDINGFNTGNPFLREGIRVNTGYPFFKRKNQNH